MDINESTDCITLTEALRVQREFPLYVINKSERAGKSSVRGDVLLNIKTAAEDVHINVPNTWIPIDLTTFADRPSILTSPVFRKLVGRGALLILKNEKAEEVLQTADAREEAGKISMNTRFSDNTSNNDLPTMKISATIQTLVTSQVSDSQFLNALRNLSDITPNDYHYMMSQLNSEEYSRTLNFIAEKVRMAK